jgi:hypothetical protein
MSAFDCKNLAVIKSLEVVFVTSASDLGRLLESLKHSQVSKGAKQRPKCIYLRESAHECK